MISTKDIIIDDLMVENVCHSGILTISDVFRRSDVRDIATQVDMSRQQLVVETLLKAVACGHDLNDYTPEKMIALEPDYFSHNDLKDKDLSELVEYILRMKYAAIESCYYLCSVISDINSQIEAYLRYNYIVPIIGIIPPVLKECGISILREYLIRNTKLGDSSASITKQADLARERLTDIANGRQLLQIQRTGSGMFVEQNDYNERHCY